VERRRNRAQRGARIAPQIIHLVSGLAAADDRAPFAIQTDGHRRHLQMTVFAPGGQNTPVVVLQKFACAFDLHRRKIRHRVFPSRPGFLVQQGAEKMRFRFTSSGFD
jgi:hypothetical protein